MNRFSMLVLQRNKEAQKVQERFADEVVRFFSGLTEKRIKIRGPYGEEVITLQGYHVQQHANSVWGVVEITPSEDPARRIRIFENMEVEEIQELEKASS